MDTLFWKINARKWMRVFALAIPLIFYLLFGPGTKPAAAATVLPGFFSGEAFASWLNSAVLPINVMSGKSALTPCPCLGTNGQTVTNQLNSLNAAPLITSGVLKSSVQTSKNEKKAVVTNSSEIAGLNLLNGLITADAIRAASKTVAVKGSSKSNDNGSTFVNLKVAGKSILDPSINTKIDLGGVGYVVLREVTHWGNGQSSSHIQIRMVHVYITTENVFGLPIGAELILAQAASGYNHSPNPVVFGGSAFTEMAQSSAVLIVSKLGAVAPVYVPCHGTNDATLTNTITSVKVKDVLTTGVGTSTARTTVSGNNGKNRTDASVTKIKLLNGLVTADSLVGVSESSYENGQLKISIEGTKLVNLKILGLPVSSNVPPNTRKNLPGFGYLILKEMLPQPDGVVVKVIHLYITTQNLLKIPVGTEIQIGVAGTSIAPLPQ